jgi:hypothetical protein
VCTLCFNAKSIVAGKRWLLSPFPSQAMCTFFCTEGLHSTICIHVGMCSSAHSGRWWCKFRTRYSGHGSARLARKWSHRNQTRPNSYHMGSGKAWKCLLTFRMELKAGGIAFRSSSTLLLGKLSLDRVIDALDFFKLY